MSELRIDTLEVPDRVRRQIEAMQAVVRELVAWAEPGDVTDLRALRQIVDEARQIEGSKP